MPRYFLPFLVFLGSLALSSCTNQKTAEPSDQQGSVTASMPKVMLGVRMAPAGPALAKHVGVHPNDATLVTFVAANTPAQRAGFEDWDIIVSVNGSSKASPTAIRQILSSSKPGDTVVFSILRGDEQIDITAELEPADHDRMVPLPIRTGPHSR